MVHVSDLIETDIDAYLHAHERKSLLRFITCGSVDDGKSTLIGRLLYESHMVFEDQLTALAADSKRSGTQGDALDFALLVDGLGAEREQGITIDVAYRYFSTDSRKFIVADTPGHEQYTRNMVTGASTADLAVILVDAGRGVLTQTRRHSYLVSLLGIRNVVVAVNKMDTIGYSQAVFDSIQTEFRAFAARIGLEAVTCIPMSALRGDNIVHHSAKTPWYSGPTLMSHLETVEVEDDIGHASFRMPVQWVNRPDPSFRGLSGPVVGGSVRVGDVVRIVPAGTTSSVARIVTRDGDLPEAVTGQSVTLVLADEVDCSRGDVLCAADSPAPAAQAFEAHVVWMSDQDLVPGRRYLVKTGTTTVGVSLSAPEHRVDVNTLEHVTALTLRLNEIGVCHLTLDRAVAFDPYSENRDTGGFIIIDPISNDTVGAGLLRSALRRADNVHWQAVEVDKQARCQQNGHRPCVVWFTGVSGAGKSTIANLVEARLHALGVHTYLLDGDNVRHGLNEDLGFTHDDRVENIRRVAEVAGLMADAGLVVLVALISPFRAGREHARSVAASGEFCEVHVHADLDVAERRDVKGLYAKSRRGELAHLTGVDSPYEEPDRPDVRVDTGSLSPEDCAARVLAALRDLGIVAAT